MSKARNLAALLGGGSSGVIQFGGTGAIQVPSGTQAQRPSTAMGQIRYNSDAGVVEVNDSLGWTPIAASPFITGVSPTSFNGVSGTVFTITGSSFSTSPTVKFVTASGTEYNATSVTRNSATSITASTPQNFTVADEPLSVKVINSSGLSFTLASAIDCGGSPSWSTASGSLATIYDLSRSGNSYQLSATEPDGQTISYSITVGALPSGMSMSSAGLINGTPNAVASDTTSSFTVRASDPAGNYSDRGFSITVKAPATSSFPYTTDTTQSFSIPAGVKNIKAKLWGAAGGTYYDGTSNNGQGAAGGYTETIFNVLSGETQLTLVVGGGSRYSNPGIGGAGIGTNGGCAGGGASIILSGNVSTPFASGTYANIAQTSITSLAGASQVIAVAGGGGGGGWYIYNGQYAGCGGGLTGGNATGGYYQPGGGTQSAGGTNYGGSPTPGKFQGAGITGSGSGGSGGGGGGWYGGGGGWTGAATNSSGGGGSGFVGYADGSTSTVLTANGSYGSYTDTTTRTNGSRTYTNSSCLRAADQGITPPKTNDANYISGVGLAGVIGASKLNGGDGLIVLIY
jgi:hypothetical protein